MKTMNNKLVLPALIIGIALVAVGYIVMSNISSQQTFALNQKCHDEAANYVATRQASLEKQVKLKLSNDTNYTALIYDTYNKDLNTCLALYGWTLVSDPVKYPHSGAIYYENIDDVLTGKNLAMWSVSYNDVTDNEELSSGTIYGKDTNNRKDFNNEIDKLFGKNSDGGHIQAPITPLPTSVYNLTPTSMPTPTPENYKTQASQNNNVFTCEAPPNDLPAPCIVSDASTGMCTDISNGEVFSCSKAYRLSNTYPFKPNYQPVPTANFNAQ